MADTKTTTAPVNDAQYAEKPSESAHEELESADSERSQKIEVKKDGLLYRDGQLILQPAPTKDPRDPMNMSWTRKSIGLTVLCFFGALAAAAELILGAMLPVFALYYADVGTVFLIDVSHEGGFPAGVNPLHYLELVPGSYPINDVYMLATMPILVIGGINLFLIPVAVAIGRRPVILISGIIAIAGAEWAGHSVGLYEHIGARCLQAVGAGTVESLIPYVINDIVPVHQRNQWISTIFAIQGLIIIILGIATPYIIIALDWRWVYHITAILAGFFLVCVFFLVPETRWDRTNDELDGIPREEPEGVVYEPRTLKYDLVIFHGKVLAKEGATALWLTLKTFFYPNIFFITVLNGAMIATALAAGYTVAPALLTAPWAWRFEYLGLCLIPLVVSAIAVSFFTGFLADKFANKVALKAGKRVPEAQILNLILPSVASVIGTVLFGLAGHDQEKYHWMVFLVGLGLMAFGFLGANGVGAVYVLECFPHLAGTALMNIASLRIIIAFLLSFRVAEWVVQMGYFKVFMIYMSIMAFFTLTLPIVYLYGASWRKRFGQTG